MNILEKRFKLSCEIVTEDRDFTAKDIEARLEQWGYSEPVEIRNVKIKKVT